MDGHIIRNKQKYHQDITMPSSDRAGDIVIREKKQNAKINLPSDSLKQIEKNRVKRQTQLFESGNVDLQSADKDENSMSPHMPSKTEYSASEKTQQGKHNSILNEGVTSSPYRYVPSQAMKEKTSMSPAQTVPPGATNKALNQPKLDVSISKAIGEQAKAQADRMKQDRHSTTKPNKPPDRPKLPPSPGIVKEKPKYPYKPSVETEVDQSKSESRHKHHAPDEHSKSNLKLNVKSLVGKDVKTPKTPSPPVRPPPPKFNVTPSDNSDKHLSKLGSGTTKRFQSASFDETIDSKQKLPEKPKVKLKPQLSVDSSQERVTGCNAAVTDATQSGLPDYAIIDKTKKVKDRLTKFEHVTGENNEQSVRPKVIIPKTFKGKTADGADISELSVGNRKSIFEGPGTVGEGHLKTVSASNQPPKKPPRTFAYDEELKKKREKRERKHKSKEKPVSPLVTADSSNYDEILQTGLRVGVRTQSSKLQPSRIKHVYEEVALEGFDKNNPLSSSGRKKRHAYETIDESSISPFVPDKSTPQLRPIFTKNLTPDSRWDKGHINVKSPHPELKKKPIVARKPIANPGYELRHECIPIKTVVMKDGSLKRYKSDESIYQGNSGESGSNRHFPSNEEPIYYDPVDVLRHSKPLVPNSHGVFVDGEGYAVPDVHGASPQVPVNRRYVKKMPAVMKRTGTMAYDHAHKPRKRSSGSSRQSIASVKEQLSEAYSVLRKRPTTELGAAALEDTQDDDSDSDVDISEQEKKLEYISTTKLRIKNKTYQSIYEKAMVKPPITQVPLMFDYALIVGLENIPDTQKYQPKVLYSFPHQDSKEMPVIASFCFPDANVWRPVTHYRTETFSFVLTASDGSRQYGYCRRFLPPHPTDQSANRLPEVYCIITSVQGWSFYGKLLEKFQQKRKTSLSSAQDLINAAYGKPLPLPGQDVWIPSLGEDDTRDTVIINRSADDRMEKVLFESLLDHLTVEKLLKVFSALLLERKLLFVAQHLGTLTECMHALVSLLYPFTWQHTFVSILPGNLLDVIDAPTPYILGILASHYAEANDRDLTEVMVIDLDNNTILRCMNDEDRIIPKKLQKALKAALKEDAVVKDTRNIMVSEAFMRLFVETIGHYTNHINTQQDGRQEFQREMFVRAVNSKSIRMFLEWFSETQMFEVFITERLENAMVQDGLFEIRLEEYQEEMSNSHPTVKQNIKDAGKKMISFLLESGGRIKKVFV